MIRLSLTLAMARMEGLCCCQLQAMSAIAQWYPRAKSTAAAWIWMVYPLRLIVIWRYVGERIWNI